MDVIEEEGRSGGEGDSDPESRSDLMGFALNELTTASVSRQLLDYAAFEFLNERQEVFASLVAAIEGEKLTDKESLEDKRCFDDLLFAEDVEFVETFRLTRKTVRILVADLKGSGYHPAAGGGVEKWLLLVLWYLGRADRSLDRAATAFALQGGANEAAAAITDVCIALATLLPELAGLSWPSDQEVCDIETNLARRYKFPRLVGLLGFFLFIPDSSGRDSPSANQSVVALQAVVDDRQRFRDVHATLVESRGQACASQVLAQSPLYTKIIEPRMDRRHLLAGSVYPQWGCLLTPFVDDGNLLEDERRFNRLHSRVMESVLQETFASMIIRFPKLGRLGLAPGDCTTVIRAATVMHNYCRMYHDMAPVA